MNEKINTIENEPDTKICIARGTIEQETRNLINALIRLNLYKKEGYNIDYSIIENPAFKKLSEEILAEVQNKELRDDEYNRIMEHFKKRAIELGCDIKVSEIINNESNLEYVNKTENAIKAKEELIKQGLERLKKVKGFEKFDEYIINLKVISQTGGQYGINNLKNNIFIKVFKNDKFLENIQILCLHEMIHTGIEESIINKYRLEHWEKERIVDLIISIVLSDICPNYIIQKKGVEELNKYITSETVYDLPSAIEKYKKENK